MSKLNCLCNIAMLETIFMHHIFFHFSGKVKVFIFFSLSFNRNGKVHYSANSLFLLTITSSGRLAEIRLSVRIIKSQKFGSFIFQDKFWVVQIPLVLMIKFKLLAQFLANHFPHPVICTLLCQLTTFHYYVIDRFSFLTA